MLCVVEHKRMHGDLWKFGAHAGIGYFEGVARNIDRYECNGVMKVEGGAQNQHGLLGRACAEFDDGGRTTGGADHVRRVALEDGLLGGGEIVLGLLGDLLKECGAGGVVKKF